MNPAIFGALTSDQLTLVRHAVEQGQYRALLGAGFSHSSVGPDGKELPLAGSLATAFAAKHGLPPSYPLATLTAAVSPDALKQDLVARFAGCRASEGARLFPSFIWRRVYTYNVDDVLDDAYASNDRAAQTIVSATHVDTFREVSDPGEVQAIYLHGYVHRPEHGFVFSTRAYADHVDEHSVWEYIFADELTTQPFVIIGCALNEFDLEVFLSRRAANAILRTKVAPSLFVTPTADRIVDSVCSRHGLIHVQATSDEFLQALDELAPSRPSVAELLRPKAANLLVGTPSAERVFFSQWTHAGDAVSQSPDPSTPQLLSGCEPTWDHIRRNEVLPRQDVPQLTAAAIKWSQSATSSFLRVVYSPAAAGKSCVMLDAARTLAQGGMPAYVWRGDARIAVSEAADLLRAAAAPVFLLIDKFGDHVDQITELLDLLRSSKTRVLVIGFDRSNRKGFIENIVGDSFYESSTVQVLSAAEAGVFVRELRRSGRLGAKAGRSDANLVAALAGNDLLSALLQVVGNTDLTSRIKSEFAQLAPLARKVYAFVCLVHQHGLRARIGIVRTAAKCSASDLVGLCDGALRELVMLDGSDFLVSRHRVVAEHTCRLLGSEAYDYYVSLAKALRPYVSRDAIKQRLLEARLAGRLFDAEVVRDVLGDRAPDFYQALVDDWQWNNRYWEQRALAVLKGDPEAALRFAAQAVGIERHPMALTTLARVQLGVARDRGYRQFEDRMLVVEGLKSARDAIDVSKLRNRREVHPHDVAVHGAAWFLKYAYGAHVDLRNWEGWELMADIVADLARVRSRGAADSLRKEWSIAAKPFGK